MPTIIIIAVISITAALIFYTLAVWQNWRAKRLEIRHLILFWFGLATDLLGTAMMGASVEEITFDLHTISGYTALVLMLTVTFLGTYAVIQHKDGIRDNFHKFSVPIWFVWALSWVTGVVLGVQKF